MKGYQVKWPSETPPGAIFRPIGNSFGNISFANRQLSRSLKFQLSPIKERKEGRTFQAIADGLMTDNILTSRGKSYWYFATIRAVVSSDNAAASARNGRIVAVSIAVSSTNSAAVRTVDQLLTLAVVLDQRAHATGRGVSCGVVPGEHQQSEEESHLGLAKALAVNSDDIVTHNDGTSSTIVTLPVTPAK